MSREDFDMMCYDDRISLLEDAFGDIVETSQDWDRETTTYTFTDGSVLIASGPDFEIE